MAYTELPRHPHFPEMPTPSFLAGRKKQGESRIVARGFFPYIGSQPVLLEIWAFLPLPPCVPCKISSSQKIYIPPRDVVVNIE